MFYGHNALHVIALSGKVYCAEGQGGARAEEGGDQGGDRKLMKKISSRRKKTGLCQLICRLLYLVLLTLALSTNTYDLHTQ